MKKTINYYGSFILLLLCCSVFFMLLVNGGEINQKIVIPSVKYLNELINSLIFK